MAKLFGDRQLLSKTKDEKASIDEEAFHFQQTKEAKSALEGKVICLFFSASWCTPCQHFVPTLKEVYTELIRRGSPLEIVFLSFDKSEQEMMDYYESKHGDWLAVKFGDPIKESLAEKYSISVIPKLIVLHPDGETITCKGRKEVQDKGAVCMQAWQASLAKHGQNDKVIVVTKVIQM